MWRIVEKKNNIIKSAILISQAVRKADATPLKQSSSLVALSLINQAGVEDEKKRPSSLDIKPT